MVKSGTRKRMEKAVSTNRVIGWNDSTTLASGVVETGSLIYTIPRKGEARLTRLLWTYLLNQTPVAVQVNYAIIDHGPVDSTVDQTVTDMIIDSIIVAAQDWRVATSVGIVQTASTIEVDLDQVISRRSNLQSDDEYSIVPVYRAGANVNVSQRGTLFVTETLFQQQVPDPQDEWAGYTFEESAS